MKSLTNDLFLFPRSRSHHVIQHKVDKIKILLYIYIHPFGNTLSGPKSIDTRLHKVDIEIRNLNSLV